MPLIEELPNTTTRVATPGYALVPDTRGLAQHDTTSAPGRKRAARASGAGAGTRDTTARQQAAILKHIAELDRDSHRDVQIPVPGKQAQRVVPGKKTTPNVRRILTSQKTWANHLADEEASLSQHSNAAGSAGPSQVTQQTAQNTTAGNDDTLANEPLLKTYIPTRPTDAEIDALLNAPALSYHAARATLPDGDTLPRRQFCEMCGHWGTIRCVKCGARVCGLGCRNAHDDGRCLKFYA